MAGRRNKGYLGPHSRSPKETDRRKTYLEIKDTGSAPKALGLELPIDDGWDQIQLARIRKMGTDWADKIRKAAYMSVNDNCKSSRVQLKPKLEYGIVAVCAPPAQLEETSMIIHYHALSPLGINQNITRK